MRRREHWPNRATLEVEFTAEDAKARWDWAADSNPLTKAIKRSFMRQFEHINPDLVFVRAGMDHVEIEYRDHTYGPEPEDIWLACPSPPPVKVRVASAYWNRWQYIEPVSFTLPMKEILMP